MLGKAQEDRVNSLMERAIACENIRICTVCNKNIKKDNLIARKVDGLWLCSLNCINKFLKEKKMWTPKEWDELCKMQALYEERKRAEINTAKKKFSKIK